MKLFWVTKRLAFGSAISTWGHVLQLHARGLTHVINLRSSRRYKSKLRSFQSLWLPFRDDKKARPAWFYRRAMCFYEGAMRQPNSKLFVMCHHGICRSASLTHFLLRASGLNYERAEHLVLGARPRAHICRAYRECAESFLERRKVRRMT